MASFLCSTLSLEARRTSIKRKRERRQRKRKREECLSGRGGDKKIVRAVNGDAIKKRRRDERKGKEMGKGKERKGEVT